MPRRPVILFAAACAVIALALGLITMVVVKGREQSAQVAKEYRAFYQKVGEGEGYTMNHALTVYVMGPDGKFRTTLGYGLGPQKATQIVRDAMARG